ncbi:MAG TPA: hypothetical protein VFL14_03030, partial [Xanthomonadales bacterium]|nr:hypothetical protein [Xanthomonadales bacterium]
LGRCYAVAAGDWTWVFGNAGPALRIDIAGAAAEQPLDASVVATYGLANGDIVVVGAANGPNIVVERLRPDGSNAWRTTFPHNGDIQDAFVEADATTLAVAIGGSTSSVSRLSLATGALQWTTAVEFAFDVEQVGGRTWALLYGADGCIAASFDAATGAARTIQTPIAPFRCRDADLAGLADGSVVVTDRDDNVRVAAGAASLAPYALDGAPGELVRLRDGSFRAIVLRNNAQGIVAIEPDGSSRIATPPPAEVTAAGSAPYAGVSAGGRTLVRTDQGRDVVAVSFDALGRETWRVQEPAAALAAAAFDDVLACDLAIASGTAPPVRLTCRSADDGSVRFTKVIEAPAGAQYPRIALTTEHSVVATWTDSLNRTTSVKRYARDGAAEGAYGTDDRVVAINALGHVAVNRQLGDGVAVLGDSGQTLFIAGQTRAEIVVPVPDGDALLTVDRNVLRRYSETGALQSQAAVNQGAFFRVVATRDGALVVEQPTSGAQVDRIVRFLDASTGSVRWERRLADLGGDVTAWVGGDRVALVGRSTYWTVNRAALSLADGRVLLRDDVPCSWCGPPSAAIDGAGTLRTFTQSMGDGRVRVQIDTLPESPRVLDARNASGAWYYAPLPGDGFVASVDATSGAFFAAWFTYAGQALPGPAGQHWYTLQGDVVAGEAVVSIYDTTGGAFDAATPVTTTSVGTARLRLVGCERIELDYAFTNGLGSGRRTMTRLTDPAHDCAGGSPPPVANGLDWRQSGAWFDPAKNGQGVLFSVDPAGPAFGAWFTYDPQGVSDDAAKQQWLTLQSTDAPPVAGRRAMTIYRTTDGRFGLRAGAYSTRVGAATLQFESCTRASLDYAFDDTLAAGSSRGLRGTLSLQRIGDCP